MVHVGSILRKIKIGSGFLVLPKRKKDPIFEDEDCPLANAEFTHKKWNDLDSKGMFSS
jgi:hypothetical protein